MTRWCGRARGHFDTVTDNDADTDKIGFEYLRLFALVTEKTLFIPLL